MQIKHTFLPLLLCAAIPAMGGVVISDSFTDGGRTDGADAQDAAWYYGNRPISLGNFTATDPDMINALTMDSNNANNAHFMAAFPSTVTLSNVGDYLEVSYTYARSATANANSAIRVGFFNDSTLPAADGFGTGYDDALGYMVGFAAGGNSNSRLFEDTFTDNSLLQDSQNTATGELLLSTNAGLKAPAANTLSTIRFRVERTATGATLTGGMTIAGGSETTFTVTDISSPYYTFNSIGFGNANMNQMNYYDDIVVTQVPEPATIALFLGLGALGLVMWRGRRA